MDDWGRLNNDGHGFLFCTRRASIPLHTLSPSKSVLLLLPMMLMMMMIMVIPLGMAIKSRWKMVIEFFHDDLHTEPQAAEQKRRPENKRSKVRKQRQSLTTTKTIQKHKQQEWYQEHLGLNGFVHWITVIIQLIIIQSVIMARRHKLRAMPTTATNPRGPRMSD